VSNLNGNDADRRLLVVGLDCAAPELVFEAWRDDLPTISGLMARGAFARLESTIPAITVPAWACMTTGLDPGQLGFYGFRNRADHSYDRMTIATSRAVRAPRLWDRLGDAGKRVGVVGVPQTYPPQPVNGHLVGCFLSPGPDSEFTYPASLREEIREWVDGEFLVDVPNFRSDDKDAILADIYRLADQHFEVCRRLLERERYDFFMTVDMGVDRIHHAFWRYMDPKHPKHEPGHRFANAIHDYYVHVDAKIAELIGLAGDDAAVLVVSDHGGKAMQGGICLNEWLIEQGYLVLREYPSQVRPLEQCEIDWARTRAWGAGGYYGRVFLNVEGREPNGVVPAEDYERERAELAERLAAITDPEGRPIGTVAYRPEDVYREVTGVPPDLIVYLGDLDWRSAGSVGHGTIWTFDNDTGPDDANHAQHGIFVLADPLAPAGGRKLPTVSIYDVAPTLLELLGLPVPASMRGRALERAGEAAYSEDEEEIVTQRLRDLGYI
jgi:predicted AlkP superfamily phosphohydrolase/phosphomutase